MPPSDEEVDRMVDLCRKAHEAAMDYGTPEMQAFTAALLHAWGKEAARPALSGTNGHAE